MERKIMNDFLRWKKDMNRKTVTFIWKQTDWKNVFSACFWREGIQDCRLYQLRK